MHEWHTTGHSKSCSLVIQCERARSHRCLMIGWRGKTSVSPGYMHAYQQVCEGRITMGRDSLGTTIVLIVRDC